MVSIDYNYKLAIEYGKLKKGQSTKKVAKKTAAPGAGSEAPAITNALAIRMSEGLTRAAKVALQTDPHAALAVLLAGLLSEGIYGTGVVRVRVDGAFESGLHSPKGNGKFADIFANYVRMTDAELIEACAAVVPELLNLTVYNAQADILNDDRRVLLEGIEPAKGCAPVSEHVRTHFDAEDYLKSAPRALKLRAIADISPGEVVKSAERLKGADLAKRAIAMVSVGEGLKWLPEELRTTDYAGPASKPVAKKPTAAKKPAKKVPAKKKK